MKIKINTNLNLFCKLSSLSVSVNFCGRNLVPFLGGYIDLQSGSL